MVIDYSLGSSNILLMNVRIAFSAMVCGVLFVAFDAGWSGPLGRAWGMFASSLVARDFIFHCILYPPAYLLGGDFKNLKMLCKIFTSATSEVWQRINH